MRMRAKPREQKRSTIVSLIIVHAIAFGAMYAVCHWFAKELEPTQPGSVPPQVLARLSAISDIVSALPLGVVGISFVACLLSHFAPRAKRVTSASSSWPATCLRCGYNREGLPSGSPCPECGLPASGLAKPQKGGGELGDSAKK